MYNSNQLSNSQMLADKAKSSLGIATNLQNQLLEMHHPPQQAQAQPGQNSQNPSQTPTDGQGEAKSPQTDKSSTPEKKDGVEEVKAEMELEMNKKLDEIRKEMKQDSQRELDEIKQLITSALAEEENEPTKTTKPA